TTLDLPRHRRSELVSLAHVKAVLGEMKKAPHHTYQSLTKAAPQLLKYTDDMPPNQWVGVSSPPDYFLGKELSRGQQEAMLRRSLPARSPRPACQAFFRRQPPSLLAEGVGGERTPPPRATPSQRYWARATFSCQTVPRFSSAHITRTR